LWRKQLRTRIWKPPRGVPRQFNRSQPQIGVISEPGQSGCLCCTPRPPLPPATASHSFPMSREACESDARMRGIQLHDSLAHRQFEHWYHFREQETMRFAAIVCTCRASDNHSWRRSSGPNSCGCKRHRQLPHKSHNNQETRHLVHQWKRQTRIRFEQWVGVARASSDTCPTGSARAKLPHRNPLLAPHCQIHSVLHTELAHASDQLHHGRADFYICFYIFLHTGALIFIHTHTHTHTHTHEPLTTNALNLLTNPRYEPPQPPQPTKYIYISIYIYKASCLPAAALITTTIL